MFVSAFQAKNGYTAVEWRQSTPFDSQHAAILLLQNNRLKKKKGEAPSGLLLLLIQVYCRSEQRRCEFKTTTKHNAKCPPPLQKKRILNSINVAALQAGKKRIYEHKKVQQHM